MHRSITIAALFCCLTCLVAQAGTVLNGLVADKATGALLADAEVTVTAPNTKILSTAVTDENGKFQVEIKPGKAYTLDIVKGGYFKYSSEIPAVKSKKIKDYSASILLEKGSVLLAGRLQNEYFDAFFEGVELKAKDLRTQKEQYFTTKANGYYEFELELNTRYLISIDQESALLKGRYKAKTVNVSTMDLDSPEPIYQNLIVRQLDGRISRERNAPLDLNPIIPEKELEKQAKQEKSESTKPGDVPVEVLRLMEGKDNIFFYPPAKANLNKFALQYLDDLAARLNQNPNLKVKISAYSDAAMEYTISNYICKLRLDLVSQYLIRQGVIFSQMELKIIGYRSLANGCYKGVDCTEQQHQHNRRIDFELLNN